MHVKSFSMLLFIKFDEAVRKDVKMEAEESKILWKTKYVDWK